MNRRQLDLCLRHCRVAPGRPLDLSRHAPDWLPAGAESSDDETVKDKAKDLLEESRKALTDAQELLWADNSYSILVILQGLDAAGKDGIIKHVMDGINPMGCHVASFKAPSNEELDHSFLWRYWRHLPERGRVGIFNRSYYEEVLVVRVHPEFLERQQLPPGTIGPKLWQERFDDIRAFERHLVRNGTVVRKFFLNVSQQEQEKRLLKRIADPTKFWKFNPGDFAERQHWAEYQQAFAEALAATSTSWAPWYVIPADRKWFARTLIAHVLAETIAGLKLTFPAPGPKDKKALAKAKRMLARD